MGFIKILPDTLISQIAAGEVIERPASVVKELLENSLDAGATHCWIQIEQGGTKLISVRDNGCGMDREDARAAFLRHATSKISTLEDLSHIQSFGFRGEALAAIASVAMVTMRTRFSDVIASDRRERSNPVGSTQNIGIAESVLSGSEESARYGGLPRNDTADAGWEITYKGGKLESEGACGCPPGTEVIVSNLFFNTPARRKFLKLETTELSHIIATVSHIAMAHPRLGFHLKHNGKVILDVSPVSQLLERITVLLGKNFLEESVAISFQVDSTKISGFIGKPGMHLSSKRQQYLFINGRDVNDPLVSRAVCDGYGSRLPGRVYPVFVLCIGIDPREIDVNVHPRKLAVKFLDPQRMYRTVVQAVEEALNPDVIARKPRYGWATEAIALEWRGATGLLRPEHMLGTRNDKEIQSAIAFNQNFAIKLRKHFPITSYQLPAASILGQIANSYILVFDEEGLAIIDQHAAHERIMYETLRAQMGEKDPDSQQLLVPVPIDCSVDETAILEDALTTLQNMGFAFEEWSGRRFLITACPLSLRQENFEKIFRDFFDSFLEDFKKEKKLLPENLLKMLACKAAVKFGMKLSPEEQYALLEELQSTPNNATCPHGRPVKVLISFEELERRFYRRK